MARPRKNETSVNIAPAAESAGPARRKAAAPRTRATAKRAAMLTKPASEEEAAIPVVTAVSEIVRPEYLPSHEEIAALAYTYWEERGYAHGDPEHDWLRAEAELRQRALATA
jgi:acetaldehyde dehydrogenase (acetylating)